MCVCMCVCGGGERYFSTLKGWKRRTFSRAGKNLKTNLELKSRQKENDNMNSELQYLWSWRSYFDVLRCSV